MKNDLANVKKLLVRVIGGQDQTTTAGISDPTRRYAFRFVGISLFSCQPMFVSSLDMYRSLEAVLP